MKKLILPLILLSTNSLSYDRFGPSSSVFGIGGQSNFDSKDAANSFYVPAILANNESTAYSFNTVGIDTQFEKIENIVVSSPINGGTTETYGTVDTEYADQYYAGIHASIKLFKSIGTKLNVSAFLPLDKLMEASTGDSYRPEYAMYKSRYERATFLTSLSHKFSSFSGSIGLLSGMQSKGETFIVAQMNGADNPTSGKLSFNAKPSAALNLSIYKDFGFLETYFSFQDEMQSELENTASGISPISASSSFKYNLDMSTMLFFDPRIYRFGIAKNLGDSNKILVHIEHQDWSNYKTPTLNFTNNNGQLISSSPTKNFKTRNITLVKIGHQFTKDTHSLSWSVAYTPSPLELVKNAAGNTVDSDTTTYALGYSKALNLAEETFNLSVGAQLHQLKELTVTKEAGTRENGKAGEKIGYPSYKVGGSVFAVSFGIHWVI